MDIGFLLNKCGDVSIIEGKKVRITGVDLIRQKWLIKVRKFKGEWVLDTESGVPYFDEIFKKIVSRKRIQDIFFKLTAEMDGVQSVTSVKVGEIDTINRSVEIEVDAILDGDEGVVFKYDGALAPDSCGLPNDSLDLSDIAGLLAWFDPQDLSVIDYQPPTVFDVQNKVSVGSFDGVDNVILEGVSDLGLKRSALLDNKDAGTQHFSIVDTPAYRGDAFSIFFVYRMKPMLGGPFIGLLALDGISDSLTREFYNLGVYYDMLNPNLSNIALKSTEFGGSTDIALSDDLPLDFETHIIQVNMDNSGNVSIFVDGNILSVSGNPITLRKLNGLGYIGPELLSNGSLSNYLFGNVGDILFFNRTVSEIERDQITGILKEKWNFEDKTTVDLVALAGQGLGANYAPLSDVSFTRIDKSKSAEKNMIVQRIMVNVSADGGVLKIGCGSLVGNLFTPRAYRTISSVGSPGVNYYFSKDGDFEEFQMLEGDYIYMYTGPGENVPYRTTDAPGLSFCYISGDHMSDTSFTVAEITGQRLQLQMQGLIL